jgi:catechol 2,3-dioxygenase
MTVQSHLAPVHIGTVTLTVRERDKMASYYQRILGLETLSQTASTITLGAGDTPLLKLVEDKAARVPSLGEAGLFHTAFLLPTRQDLAAWTAYAIENRLEISGASDHLVSEALYLNDPEGNGIEIYRDREPSEWPRENGAIEMATDPMDFQGLLASLEGTGTRWKAAPADTRVGHIHLKVGDTLAAETFYTQQLGLDLVTRYPGAAFMSSGGYHHHIGANVWQSRGAQKRTPSLGLASFELIADASAYAKLQSALSADAADPWGNQIELKRKA